MVLLTQQLDLVFEVWVSFQLPFRVGFSVLFDSRCYGTYRLIVD